MTGFTCANAHSVTDRIAVGGDLSYDDTLAVTQALDLVAAGITHVLDVRQECEDEELWALVPEVDYLWAGIDDAGQQVPGAWFNRIVSWALAALEDPDAKVLAHCHMGINRGPSAGYAIMLGLGWDPVDALAAIRAARPIANIWYAEDALAWHFDRLGIPPTTRAETLARVRRWRAENPLDVVRIIRSIRMGEAS